MAVEFHPTWSFEPNWSSSLTETLEWLTDVLTSPTGSEQRRSLRFYPRRTYEFTIAVEGGERSLLDNMLVSYSGNRWYLPLWHDVNYSEVPYPVGAIFLPCVTALTSQLRVGGIAIVISTAFHYEVVQITAISSTGVAISAPLSKQFSSDVRIYPVLLARLTDQPKLDKRNDALVTAPVRFRVVEATPNSDALPTGLVDTYRGFFVLSAAPDERTNLPADIERMLVELDNSTSIPVVADSAQRSFTLTQYAWFLEGRSQYKNFLGFLQYLRGRAIPLWVPTFMQDFDLAEPVESGSNVLIVKNAGFTLAGGPRMDRVDIMIETETFRIFRRITDSSVASDGSENLVLDVLIPVNIPLDSVVRISFITLMRSNQDSIQIDHPTDTEGVSTALVTFRSAPNTRIPQPANF